MTITKAIEELERLTDLRPDAFTHDLSDLRDHARRCVDWIDDHSSTVLNVLRLQTSEKFRDGHEEAEGDMQ